MDINLIQIIEQYNSEEHSRELLERLRWAAAALLMTESNFRRIMGYRGLWMLKAALGPKEVSLQQEVA